MRQRNPALYAQAIKDMVKAIYADLKLSDDALLDEIGADYFTRQCSNIIHEKIWDKENATWLDTMMQMVNDMWRSVAQHFAWNDVEDRILAENLDLKESMGLLVDQMMKGKKLKDADRCKISEAHNDMRTAFTARRPTMYSRDNKKASPETETMGIGEPQPNNATAISSDAGAKVLQNIDIVIDTYNKNANKTKGFITDISQALDLIQHESSHYGTFTLPDGKKITVRISNHNARVSNFDDNSEQEAVSVVISSYKNKGLKGDGEANVQEYFYSKKQLENLEGKPLADIAQSIKDLLLTGEYTDRTGIAQTQTVKKGFVPNELHSTFVSDIEIYNAASTVHTEIIASATNVENSVIIDAKLQQFFETAKAARENSSKVVDENGEPLVVIHRTNDEFNTFEPQSNKHGRVLGNRYYFSQSDNNKNFGEIKKEVFLNIRNPNLSEEFSTQSLLNKNKYPKYKRKSQRISVNVAF